MALLEDKATQAIRETAADWIVKLNAADASAADRVDFSAWLRRSPQHVKEYLRAEAAWLAMENAASRDVSDVPTLLRNAPPNVIELGVDLSPRTALEAPAPISPRRGPLTHYRMAVAAAALLALGVVFMPRVVERLDPNAYATEVGELRRVMLADGSSVELNTRTRIQVRYSEHAREVALVAGEAFFDVAQDPARPFKVLSDAAVVRAVGTQFNVYRQAQETLVTVIEGRVAIESKAVTQQVDAGSGVRIASNEVIQPAAVSPRSAVAWRQRRLVFENESLATVAAEFNRYNTQQLVIADPELAQERISGVFSPKKPQALVSFLEQTDAVRVTHSAEQVVLNR